MSGEREVFSGLPSGLGSDRDGDGPNAERLSRIRRQAAGFEAAASRAFAFAERRSSSARQILQSIRNTSGQ